MQSSPAQLLASSLQPVSDPAIIPSDPTKKRKKKRSRDDAHTDTSHIDAPKDKKKKRSHHDEKSSEITPVIATPGPSSAVINDASKEEKRKKKDKGKAKTTTNIAVQPSNELAIQVEGLSNGLASVPVPELSMEDMDANAQASTAALLSAIVAAATGAAPDMLGIASAGQIDPQYPSAPMLPNGHSPFMPMPMPFPSPLPSASDPSSFSNMGLPFSDLSFDSNEDVLRALQDLDITKIANVLKTLGEAAAAANVSPLAPQYAPPPMFYPMNPPVQLTPVGQAPAPSNAILGIPPKKSARVKNVDTTPAAPEQPDNEDHAELLATKWMGTSKLAELVKSEGLVYKKGKFSATEEQSLQEAISRFQCDEKLTNEQLQDAIFPKNGDRDKTMPFWQQVTASVPRRPIIAVYHHVRRTYHPLKQQGKWSPEEDGRLKQAVADLGQQWEKVSARVGRMSADCRDRYRNHVQDRELRITGPWSKEEEVQLTKIVTDMTVNQGKDIDDDVFWGKVSELMGGRRGRQQCRIKWTDALSKTVKNEGQKPRWSQQDGFILVHKVDSLNVRDDTEIDWKTLNDPDWNLWSAHALQRRWLTMKRSIKGYENMSHAEIMDILRVKKAHLPLPPSQSTKKRKERKVTSAAAIPDADAVGSADATRAGSSSSSRVDEDLDPDSDSSSSGSESDSD